MSASDYNSSVPRNEWGQPLYELREEELIPHVPVPKPKKVPKSEMKEFVKFSNEKGVVYS